MDKGHKQAIFKRQMTTDTWKIKCSDLVAVGIITNEILSNVRFWTLNPNMKLLEMGTVEGY